MLKAGRNLGQYRIARKIDEGGYADVYQALDTIEGTKVALKIPHADFVDKETLELFRKEVRTAARLDHPNILLIKHAGFLDGHFVIVYPLGKGSLGDRLRRSLSVPRALRFAEQMLEAAACAHRSGIAHLDIKPENLILFQEDRLRLADFGLARVARYTLRGSGTGTVGYMAPEQAMGRPSLRSDVFSLGLILYRMLSGRLPEFPYKWPFPACDRVRRRVPPGLMDLIRKAVDMDPRKRHRDAVRMLNVFRKIRPKALAGAALKRHHGKRRKARAEDLDAIRFRLFSARYGRELETRFECPRCGGPVSEAMTTCPWCGRPRKVHPGATRYPDHCRRCGRGRKLDWRFCAWCHGPGFRKVSAKRFSDARYAARCPDCREASLVSFARYCPRCRAKFRRRWDFKKSTSRCPRCRWGVLPEFWKTCPWCGRSL